MKKTTTHQKPKTIIKTNKMQTKLMLSGRQKDRKQIEGGNKINRKGKKTLSVGAIEERVRREKMNQNMKRMGRCVAI